MLPRRSVPGAPTARCSLQQRRRRRDRACKHQGIRASVCHDVWSAHQAVEHDDMNVLCLGSEIVGATLAAELVRSFAGASFDGEDGHRRRLETLARLEAAILA